MTGRNEKDELTIVLSHNEAVVFFDWVSRFNELENAAFFEDQAEQRVLYDLEAVLEPLLTEAIQEDYRDLVANARTSIRDQE